jgi:hypothetical protein
MDNFITTLVPAIFLVFDEHSALTVKVGSGTDAGCVGGWGC